MEKGKPQQGILAASPTAIWNTNQPNSSISHRQKGKPSNPLKFHKEKTHRRRGIVPLLWDSIPSSGQHRLTTGRLQPSGIQPLSGVQMLTRNSRGWESGGWGWTDPCAKVPVGHWLAEDHAQSPQKCENLQFWDIPACFLYRDQVSVTSGDQAAGQHSTSLYFRWTFWLALLDLQEKLEPHSALAAGRVQREAVCYLFIHSFTLLGTRGPTVTRQIKAPALSALVEWHEIWGRSTGALLPALAFTVRMISPIPKLSELSSLGCQVCAMMPPSHNSMSGRIYWNKCECFNYKDHIDFSYYC